MYPDCINGGQCVSIMMPPTPTNERSECMCMTTDMRELLEQHAAMGLPTSVPDQFRRQIPSLCICMTSEMRAFLEACAEQNAGRPEYNGQSDNDHSPASMDLSENPTPSSSGHPAGSVYSPLGFSDPSVPLQYEPPKEGGWELLDFGSGDYYLDAR